MKKSALVLQDLSAYTKASINISLPILEKNNIDTAVLPLSLLATQSDGFDNFFIKDLSSECKAIINRFLDNNFSFDGLLSSYIATKEQFKLVNEVFDKFSSLIIVDPVLGDDLKLYQGFDNTHILLMRELIKKADIITPNITEACLLAGYELKEKYSKKDINELISSLRDITTATVVITSACIEDDKITNVIYDKDKLDYISLDKINASYPGSGDLFSSLLLSFILNKYSLYDSALKAAIITSDCIKYTYESKRERRYGIDIINALRKE